MIYLLFACFCAFFFFSWKQLREVARHDGVLFPFCQLRRDVMMLLRQYYTDEISLSREEIQALMELSKVLDKTISNYNRHKTEMFNLRKVIAYIKKYPRVLEQVKPLELPDSPKIRKLHVQFVVLSAKAFLAYTPLIRSQLVWFVLLQISRRVTARLRKEAIETAAQIRTAARGDVSAATA